jgi:serine/threonine protein kinase/Tol biopolymer transport system component
MIEPGQSLGPYEVVESIGSGGMGEVFRARDTRLDREVAIKVLPPGMEQDEERRGRFEREARIISQLNHPHICTLHDIGLERDQHYLVMELLDGESLADRLQKGPLPLSQALRFGTQVAEALDAAHRQGITHRDLKPANVMLTKSGAKLLDFGLARAGTEAPPVADSTSLPTAVRPLTEKGTVMGTFQYMAPEQLEGLPADERTDIFALGVLLFEMVTGRKAFEGATRTSLIAAIVSSQPPPASSVVAVSPPGLDHVIQKCLEKDRDDRWQSAHDVAGELRWIAQAGSQSGQAVVSPGRRGVRRRDALALAAGLVGVLLGAAGTLLLRSPASLQSVRPPLRFVVENGDLSDSRPRLSPDGRRLAYRRDDALWVRDLARLEPVRVAGTEGAEVPFWSPDGTWLGFTAEGKLWKIRADGSGKTVLCAQEAPGVNAGGAAWLPDGRIVFNTGRSPLLEVSDRGGDARVLLDLGDNEADFHNVSALPDGKGFLFGVHEGDSFGNITVWDGTERRTLMRLPGEMISEPVYAPSGHIVYARSLGEGPGIWAVPFSLDRLELTGDPFPVAPGGAQPSVAPDRTLAYVPQAPRVLARLVRTDRSGRILQVIGEPRAGLYPTPALSPDGRRVAVPVAGPSGWDLWLYDLQGGEPTRLTFLEAPGVGDPVWTPDGHEVVFSWSSSTSNGTLRATTIDGSRAIRDVVQGVGKAALSADGRDVVYDHVGAGFNLDLWHKASGEDGPGQPLLAEEGWETNPALSPDGRWLAYEKGGTVLIRTYPDMKGPWQVATGGAVVPRWGPRGDRLYYLSGNALMEVEVTTPGPRVGAPRTLFTFAHAPASEEDTPAFAVSPDGESFILVEALEPIPGIVVVQNWPASVE